MIRKKGAASLILFILAGIVLGGFLALVTKDISWLSWLNYGQTFGLENPLVLDLGVFVITFGLTIRITIAGIIGMVLAIVLYSRL